jgi:carboxypeptidase family protein
MEKGGLGMTAIFGRTILLAILFASTCTTASFGQTSLGGARQGVLVGDVADKSENAPIPDAFVYIHGDRRHPDVVAKIDRGGRFQVSLPPGYYDVFVAASGFAPTCKAIEIESGGTVHFNPRLGPDFEHLQP